MRSDRSSSDLKKRNLGIGSRLNPQIPIRNPLQVFSIMAEKRPVSRLALKNLSTNIPLKKVKEEPRKNFVSNGVSAAKPSEISQKTSLLCKNNERLTKDDEAVPLEEQLYKEGYQRDYIRFLLHDEKRFVLDRNFLQTSVFTTTSRYSVVNLLLKMQQYFKTPDNQYYMAVKLMDLSSKICTEPESKEGVLLAITSFWIVHKFVDNNIFISLKSILKFLRLLPGMHHKYRAEDILTMERRVLTLTKFTVQLPDPAIFIEHFLRKLKLIPNKLVYHGTYFVCDCLSTFPKFSYLETSLVAAIALYTTLVVMEANTSRFIQMTQNVFHEEILKKNCEDAISKIYYIGKMVQCREPFVKYSTMEKLGISSRFENYIRKMDWQNNSFNRK